MNLLGIQDLILAPVIFFLAWQLGKKYAQKKYGNSALADYFVNGLMLRIAGGVLIGLIYVFIFETGDTIVSFKRSKFITSLLFSDPSTNWIILFPEFFYVDIINLPGFPIEMLAKSNAYIVVRVGAVLNIFLFDSFFATTIVFSLWGFLGSWKLFQVFYHYKPSIAPKAALFCLYLPSILLWGSGILKDTLSFGGLCILVYCVYNIFIRHLYKPKYFIYGAFCIYLVGVAKSYILLALAPSLIFFILNQYGARIKAPFLRTVFFPVILALVIGISFVILNALSSTFTAYSLDNMEEKAEGFHRWHAIRSEQTNGSGYTLPEGNIVIKVMAAINATLFRPYLWETKKPLVFLAALESLYLLLFTLHSIRRVGPRILLKSLITDPMISFCFVFSLTFAFGVGSTSYNFGALSRFKIPCIPFYMAALCLSRIKKNEEVLQESIKANLIKRG